MSASRQWGLFNGLPGIVLAVAALTGCAAPPLERLAPVPDFDPAGLSASATAQFNKEQARLRQLLSGSRPDTRTLMETYGRLGELGHASQRVDYARTCYGNAALLAPDDPRWPYYLGHLERFAGNADESVRQFERALELSPDDAATLIHLGELYLERDEAARAEDLFRRALAAGDPSAAAVVGLGRALAAGGDLAGAAERFEEALARVPAAKRIHYHLGTVYGRLGDRERAEAHMAQQGPGLPRPADRLMDEVNRLQELAKSRPGSVAVQEGRTEDALVELRAALAANPEDPDALLGLATLTAQRGDLTEAEGFYREALRLAIDRSMRQNASLNFGNLLADTDRPDEALEHYRAAVELDPETRDADEARLQLVRTLIRLGRLAEDQQAYRAVLGGAPRDPLLYIQAAEALGQAGRHADARWVFQRGREAHPNDARIANALAQFLATCPDDGVRDGATALRLASSLFSAAKSGPHAITLAMALAENGRFDDAVKLQRAALAEAEQMGRTEIVGRLRTDLALYESGRPVRR